MGKYYCCMTNCHNFSGKTGKFGKPVTLHKLPQHISTRRAWVRAISRKYWKPTAYTRVCSDHFSDGIGPNSLNRYNIPTEHLAQKENTPSREPTGRSRRLFSSPLSLFNVLSRPTDDATSLTNPPASTSAPIPGTMSDTVTGDHAVLLHGYANCSDDTLTDDRPIVSDQQSSLHTCSVSVQIGPEMCDASINVDKPEITIEDIKDSDDKIMFYTGLPSYKIFNSLFETLMDFGCDKLCISTGSDSKSDTGRKRKLRPVDEFLLVMIRLRLGLLVKDMEYRFKVSSSTISKIFNTWLSFMYKYLQSLVFLPKLDVLQKHIPQCFHHFSDTRVILDCTEIFIQTPSSLENKSVTYSNYKSHNTFKLLVGISMTGAVVFVSKLWGGSVSDVQITRDSGLIPKLNAGDAVMVDKGFIHLKPDLEKQGVKLYCPPFKNKDQFTKNEVELTRRIASARIHVERKMEQIKNSRLLQGIMPLAINKTADEIVFVCCALTNLLPPLIS